MRKPDEAKILKSQDLSDFWQRKFEHNSSKQSRSVARNGFFLSKGTNEIRSSIQAMVGQVQDIKLLDAGCGDGSVTRSFSTHNHVTGLDLSTGMLALAKEAGLHPKHGSFEDPPFKPASFDIVLCVEAVTLSSDPIATIKKLACLVHPDGRLIISSVNRGSWPRFLAERTLDIINRPYPYALRLAEICSAVESVGFEVDEMRCVIAAPGWAKSITIQDQNAGILRFANNVMISAKVLNHE